MFRPERAARKSILLCCLFFGFQLGATAAFGAYQSAGQGHGEDAHPGESADPAPDHDEAEENHYFAGAKGAYLYGTNGEAGGHHFGGGIFFELTLKPQMLEMEFAVKLMSAHDGVALPIDILLKVPFHLSKVAIPFIGIGPTAVLAIHGDVTAHFGAALTVGSTFWVHSHFGFLAEANVNILFEHGALYEFGGAVGAVAGW